MGSACIDHRLRKVLIIFYRVLVLWTTSKKLLRGRMTFRSPSLFPLLTLVFYPHRTSRQNPMRFIVQCPLDFLIILRSDGGRVD